MRVYRADETELEKCGGGEDQGEVVPGFCQLRAERHKGNPHQRDPRGPAFSRAGVSGQMRRRRRRRIQPQDGRICCMNRDWEG